MDQRLELVAAPTAEPLTVAEAKAHLRTNDAGADPAPVAPTVALISPAVAGNVDNGAHRYRVAFVDTDVIEGDAGAVSVAVTVADKTVNGKVSLTLIPVGTSTVGSRKIYRTTAGGSVYRLLTTIADNTTTTYTDNTADASLGAPLSEDAETARWITAARREAERISLRAFVSQTWRLLLDSFPCEGEIELPLPPLSSVTAITYLDENGDSQTVDADTYVVDASGAKGRVYLKYGESWPTTYCQPNAVQIEFVAGYGEPADVPEDFKSWILLNIGDRNENRESQGTGTVRYSLDHVDGLLLGERVGL